MAKTGSENAALLDLDRGISTVLVSGADARDYLDRMASADLKQLKRERGLWSALLSSKGKLRAIYTLFETDPAWPKCSDGTFLLAVESACEAVLVEALASRVIREDVSVESARETFAWLSIQGMEAARILAVALSESVATTQWPELPRQCARPAPASPAMLIVRQARGLEGGFDLLAARTRVAELRALVCAAGAVEIDDAAADALRIDAGLPRYGIDATDENLPPEAGYETALSYHKCYVGQEIVARLRSYGHVNWLLRRIRFASGVPPAPGATLRAEADGAIGIGHVTSSAYSPADGRPVALGYVRYKSSAPGTRVIAGEEVGVLEDLHAETRPA